MYTIRQAAEVTGASVISLRIWLAGDEERPKRFPNARRESYIKGFVNPGRGRPRKKSADKSKNEG